MRQVLVQALILLRNRSQFPCMRTLPTYFKLFTLQDKVLRKIVFKHIVRDIVQMNKTSKSQKSNNELRDFFFERLKEGEVEVARRACAVFISLYRQNVWRDAHVVNLMSAGLLHPDPKIAAALAHLFLGNKTKGLELNVCCRSCSIRHCCKRFQRLVFMRTFDAIQSGCCYGRGCG